MSTQSVTQQEDLLSSLFQCEQAIKKLDEMIIEYGKVVDSLHEQREKAIKLKETISGTLDHMEEQGRAGE